MDRSTNALPPKAGLVTLKTLSINPVGRFQTGSQYDPLDLLNALLW